MFMVLQGCFRVLSCATDKKDSEGERRTPCGVLPGLLASFDPAEVMSGSAPEARTVPSESTHRLLESSERSVLRPRQLPARLPSPRRRAARTRTELPMSGLSLESSKVPTTMQSNCREYIMKPGIPCSRISHLGNHNCQLCLCSISHAELL